jgi:hypothetical protein
MGKWYTIMKNLYVYTKIKLRMFDYQNQTLHIKPHNLVYLIILKFTDKTTLLLFITSYSSAKILNPITSTLFPKNEAKWTFYPTPNHTSTMSWCNKDWNMNTIIIRFSKNITVLIILCSHYPSSLISYIHICNWFDYEINI